MPEPEPQVFISYHRADLAVAEQVRTHLVANSVKTWMDSYDIPAGAYWPDEIDEALNQSELIVGLLSPDSAASRNVKNEWDWAIQNDKQLILIKTRTCVIPHRYVSINFIDATSGDLDDTLQAILNVPELQSKPETFVIPRTRYARSGDLNVAYQVFGDGDVDLIFAPGFISHVEHFWKLPAEVEFLKRFASFSRVMMFDKRGTGMSDRVAGIPPLEERMDDIRAVMDACQSERAIIAGVSEGVPLAILFAATHPERAQSLILYGGSATYVQQPDYPWQAPMEQKRREIDEAAITLPERWGTEELAREVIKSWAAPSAVSDEALVSWFAEMMRLGASPGAIIALRRMNLPVDVRQVLPAIRVPTLVINRVGDRDAKIEEARYIAGRIPGAQLVELPGDDHLPMVGDQESLFAAIERFVSSAPRDIGVDTQETVLATVVHLTSDAIDPERLIASARAESGSYRGRILGTTAGIDIVFDGPARAVRFAAAVFERASEDGQELRGGVRTGEMELDERGGSGPPLDTARLLAAGARPGQLLATNTVRDLVASAGIRFERPPRGQDAKVPGVSQILVVARSALS